MTTKKEIRKILKNFQPSNQPLSFRQPINKQDIRQSIPAAVLVALKNSPQGWEILLTKRSAHLTDHPGQISFVGGRVDPKDISHDQTALREAYEEVKLPQKSVEIIGQLSPQLIAHKYYVYPYIGFIENFTPLIQHTEVEELFYIPLEFILQDKNCLKDNRPPNYQGYKFVYNGMNIWGGTASILLNLKHILKNDF